MFIFADSFAAPYLNNNKVDKSCTFSHLKSLNQKMSVNIISHPRPVDLDLALLEEPVNVGHVAFLFDDFLSFQHYLSKLKFLIRHGGKITGGWGNQTCVSWSWFMSCRCKTKNVKRTKMDFKVLSVHRISLHCYQKESLGAHIHVSWFLVFCFWRANIQGENHLKLSATLSATLPVIDAYNHV